MESDAGTPPIRPSTVCFDCGPRCRSREHAAELIIAITNGTSEQAIAFLSRCHNAECVTDEFGRSALHVAASCNKLSVLRWLVDRGASLSAVDRESGWTALHRAAFYGQLSTARVLISHGSNMYLRDREALSALDLIMKDRLPHVDFINSGLSQVYTWGVNSNSTLGHDNMQRKKLPERVEFFRKQASGIKSVVLGKYHGVFLTTSGQVYTCGHGLGGRLGHEHKTCLVPKLVVGLENEICIQVAASHNHTVILTESYKVYSCGLNNYGQLGYVTQNEFSATPKLINPKALKGREVIGVCASSFHTVLYTRDTIYTFGLNCGQLGHGRQASEPMVREPRVVSALVHKDMLLHLVTASDAATIVVTSRGDVFALHEYQCTRIISKWVNIVQVCAVGGRLDASVSVERGGGGGMGESVEGGGVRLNDKGGSPLTVMLLTSAGYLYLWRDTDPIPRRCVWSLRRPLGVAQFSLSATSVAMVTRDGEAFTAQLSAMLSSSTVQSLRLTSSFTRNKERLLNHSLTLSDLVDRDDVIQVKVNRVALVHRATAIYVDSQGLNFAVLQSHPSACITSIPSVTESDMQRHLLSLLTNVHSDDGIHDVVLQVNSTRIFAHKYILASTSGYFRNLFINSSNGSAPSEDNNLNATSDGSITVVKLDLRDDDVKLFKQLLSFIYTDTCAMLKPGSRVDDITAQNAVRLTETGDVYHNGSDSVRQKDDSLSMNVLNENVRNNGGKVESAYKVNRKTAGKSLRDSEKSDESLSAMSKNEPLSATSKDLADSPVLRFKELAKVFGVKGLVKRLDSIYCSEGFIVVKKRASLPPPLPVFKLSKSEVQLCDVCIESEDDCSFPCHKCVLVARSDYFTSMFSSGWFEMSNAKSLKLSIPGNVVWIILQYLYTDESPLVSACEDAEFLCNVLAVADQLLIGRLKDQSEVAIAQLLTLRNVADILEFASMCGANQLKATCHQFITINLAALLETSQMSYFNLVLCNVINAGFSNMDLMVVQDLAYAKRSLDRLSDEVMEELTQYYRNTILGMSRRIITPYSGWRELNQPESLEGADVSASVRKSKSRRKKARTKVETAELTGMTGNVDLECEVLPEKSPTESVDVVVPRSICEQSADKEESFDDEAAAQLADLSDIVASQNITPVQANWWLNRFVCVPKPTESISPASKSLISSPIRTKQDIKSLEFIGNPAIALREAKSNNQHPTKAAALLPCDLPSSAGFCLKTKDGSVSPNLGKLSDGLERTLTTPSSGVARNTQNDPVSPESSKSLRAIMAEETAVTPKQVSPSVEKFASASKKTKKLSQKDRKLQSLADILPSEEVAEKAVTEAVTSPSNPWKSIGQVVKSFKDLMLSDVQQLKAETAPVLMSAQLRSAQSPGSAQAVKASQPIAVPNSRAATAARGALSPRQAASPTDESFSWGLAFGSVRSKLASLPPAGSSPVASSPPATPAACQWSSASPPELAVSFADVLQAEQEQSVTSRRAFNKPLAHIQKEERAILWLLEHYNAADSAHEYITVERVSAAYNRPLWAATQRQQALY